ncbi:50S ribosomal protein L9 [Luteibaculum oceani]|uniref:Large ribosomal subunit protein bL9 n=1 Tax=Luteibaculum oceani TaxID=1294296 RepID=A0A5C6V8J7_9FLAO|nr:50S ribosomal protein L9 [Luteibaculum oceani]TXC81712.1 50S ribosomal protein L9 [Luteibaculum oceani]
MEVILKKDVQNLGYKDELVTVKNGYGLNYLIPQGFAVLATESAKKVLAENQRQRAHKEAKIKDEAQKLADKVSGVKLTVGAKAGENGKIFGSVNTIQLAEAFKGKGLEIDRKHIILKDDSVKTLGSYKATVKLHREVSAEFEFEVIEE